jgi:DUF1680 family protein
MALTFQLKDVELSEGIFKDAQATDLNYILSLDVDRLLFPYLKDSGIPTEAQPYPNWESTGLDGHTAGHYLSALAMIHASNRDRETERRLRYMVGVLQKCQSKNGNGYVGGIPNGKKIWWQVSHGEIKANGFSVNGGWVPLYNIHKLFNGLYDAYAIGQIKEAKTVLIGLTDWFDRTFSPLSDEQIQNLLISEHGGLNEIFANVYTLTGNKKYLLLARRFTQRAFLDPLLHNSDKLTGLHANTQIPKVVGIARIASVDSDSTFFNASDFFWSSVTQNRTVAFGGNSVREHFNPVNDFSGMLESREGPETCNSYNMLRLSTELFRQRPQAKYIDYYEKTLFNHILSSQRPEGGFVYFTPIRPGHYRVYSSPQESFWCCVGTGLENHAKYGELIYAHTGNSLYVNLFMASKVKWKDFGLELTQKTEFPFKQRSSFTLTLKRALEFELKIRRPCWLGSTMEVFLNGKNIKVKTGLDGYISIDRLWRSGDVVEINLPMTISASFLPDHSNYLAFSYGPIVLAADMGKESQNGQTAGSERMGHIAEGTLLPLDKAPLIVAEKNALNSGIILKDSLTLSFSARSLINQAKYRSLTLVPFFTLSNKRYEIYWPYSTPKDLSKRLSTFNDKESRTRRLDSLTVDYINIGEQQPEIDHQFSGNGSEAGRFKERGFRKSKDWFSYVLRNSEKNAKNLQVTYYGSEKNNGFDLLLNGKLIRKVILEGTNGDDFYTETYSIPKDLSLLQELSIRFQPSPGSTTPNIYHIRLLK